MDLQEGAGRNERKEQESQPLRQQRDRMDERSIEKGKQGQCLLLKRRKRSCTEWQKWKSGGERKKPGG
jgi:hypothetical protein